MRNLQRLVQIILLARVAFVPARLMAQQEKMQPENSLFYNEEIYDAGVVPATGRCLAK